MSDYMSNAIESPNHTDEETGDAATFLAILKCTIVIWLVTAQCLQWHRRTTWNNENGNRKWICDNWWYKHHYRGMQHI